MQEHEREALIEDFFALRPRSPDAELSAVETALFVEQTFGIRLTDADISPAVLGSPDSVRRRILRAEGAR